MRTHTAMIRALPLLAPLALTACNPQTPMDVTAPDALDARLDVVSTLDADHSVRSIAAYTFQDVDARGCLDPTFLGICSHFTEKENVFLSGGPQIAGLEDGDYYFAVLAPGYLGAAVQDGMDGNLSDDHPGLTTGDDGSGDTRAERTFEVRDHEIVRYYGEHATGETRSGRMLINLGDFDDAPNPYGLYVLAICAKDLTPWASCTMDAFLVNKEMKSGQPYVSGTTYYDANTDGHLSPGEVGISDFTIIYEGTEQGREEPALDGTFSLAMEPGTYTFRQDLPGGRWVQTGNHALQAVMFGESTVTLGQDMDYELSLEGSSVTDGLFFGDVCLGEGGAHTTTFWGDSPRFAHVSLTDLEMLRELNLRDINGLGFNPTSELEFQAWITRASSANIAARLSAQLAAMALNVRHDFVVDTDLVYAPDFDGSNDAGFMTVRELLGEADDALSHRKSTLEWGPDLPLQLRLLSALEDANGDESFVQDSPLRCDVTPTLPDGI